MAQGMTGLSGLAGRYALALIELADEKKALDAVAQDLRGLGALIEDSADLNRLLTSPVYGRDEQIKALTTILGQAGVNDITLRFVKVVASNRRLFALGDMARAYLGELARRRGEIVAEVTSARPLADAQHQALVEALRKAVGSKVQVEAKVDQSLIGGLIVKVGSRMVDASLRSKLQRLQLVMKGAG